MGTKQNPMVVKLQAGCLALITLLEKTQFQRIVLAVATHVVHEDVIVGNLVPIFSVVPEPADIVNQFPIVINQHIVNGDHTLVMIARGWILLKDFQTPFVEALNIPFNFGEKSIPTGLIGGTSKFTIHSVDGLFSRNDQTRQILGKM